MACMCVFLLYLLYFICPLGPCTYFTLSVLGVHVCLSTVLTLLYLSSWTILAMHVCLSTVLTLLYLSSWTILWHACLSFYCTYFTLSVLLDHPMACMCVFLLYLLYFICPLGPSWPCMCVFLLYLLYFICPLGPSYGHACLSFYCTYFTLSVLLDHPGCACLSFYCTYFTLSVLLDHPMACMCVFLLYLLYFIRALGPSYGMHVCLSVEIT